MCLISLFLCLEEACMPQPRTSNCAAVFSSGRYMAGTLGLVPDYEIFLKCCFPSTVALVHKGGWNSSSSVRVTSKCQLLVGHTGGVNYSTCLEASHEGQRMFEVFIVCQSNKRWVSATPRHSWGWCQDLSLNSSSGKHIKTCPFHFL